MFAYGPRIEPIFFFLAATMHPPVLPFFQILTVGQAYLCRYSFVLRLLLLVTEVKAGIESHTLWVSRRF